MPLTTCVFLGDFSADLIPLDRVADHVGWSVHCAAGLGSLAALAQDRDIPAVFVDAPLLAQSVRDLLPRARIVLCVPLDRVGDIEPAAAGVFHVIARPLQAEEIRQSIGFVWQAWSRPRLVAHAAA